MNFCVLASFCAVFFAHSPENHASDTGPEQKQRPAITERSAAEVSKITPVDLMKRITKGESIFIVDVRSAAEYLDVRIPGAVSVPLEEVQSRVGTFPGDRDIVLY